ncbi:MAG: glycosyltransferase family 2 protein [Fimbriimonadaceae bacterium]|nr:glycosyltransferase family 2 protein [Alphaproteobacteria bacterium]
MTTNNQSAKTARSLNAIESDIKLSIVVPTLNESENVVPLFESIARLLKPAEFEIIFVDDDSPDGTAKVAKSLAANDRRVRCIKRVGRRGLSSAAIEGFLAASAPYVALIDGDMQHDETILPEMMEQLDEGADLVIASRYIAGGSADGLDNQNREYLSNMGNRLAKLVLKRDVSDPMSGFFMMRRELADEIAPKLSLHGFKILVDIIASSNKRLKIVEVPFVFRERGAGESKLDNAAKLDYLKLLIDKSIGKFLPLRFIMFSAVGGLGVFVHLGVLSVGLEILHLPFALSQGIAAFTAMTINFLLNNLYTYADRKLHGYKLIFGLLSFYAICSVGFVANVGLGDFLFDMGNEWWLSGFLGAVIGSVWNYAVSSVLTWRKT